MNNSDNEPDFSELHENASLKQMYEKYTDFKEKIRKEKIAGETGIYWLNYIDIMNEIEIFATMCSFA